jgi:hypothetical protein
MGGVGAGPGPGAATGCPYLPARASFFGVRSLSLVLADFGTLLFFVLLFIFILLSYLVDRLRSTQFGMIRNHARASKLSKGLKMRCGYLINQQALMQRSVPQRFITNGKNRVSVSLQIEAALAHFWSPRASVLNTYLTLRANYTHTATFFVGTRRAMQRRVMRLCRSPCLRATHNTSRSGYAFADSSAFADHEEVCFGSISQFQVRARYRARRVIELG